MECEYTILNDICFMLSLITYRENEVNNDRILLLLHFPNKNLKRILHSKMFDLKWVTARQSTQFNLSGAIAIPLLHHKTKANLQSATL